MRIFAIADNDGRLRCPSCLWRVSRLFVIAKDEKEAKEMFNKGNGLCADCLVDMMVEEKYEIVVPEK
ncbi:MAG TPA: hypothetical protein ENF41_03295 [Candidatus Bathyarchaeota archaeon]|mgnify:CR=1 FL=1|nr:hypothetical protein [Candidatus Bathyarchaeota archaeon]